MEVDNTIALIVGDPQGILGQHLRPQPMEQCIFDTNAVKKLS
jgi:hypothetical protein